jgi:hypothetical protein
MMPLSDRRRYSCPYAFAGLLHGWATGKLKSQMEKYSMNKNVLESVKLHEAVRAKHKQCYINAVRVIWNVPGYKRATYVEGIAVVDGMCIEHGWVEREAEIFDPTLPDEIMVYFPGLKFAGEKGIAEAMRRPKPEGAEDLPFFCRYGWSGRVSPEFCNAWKQALEFTASGSIVVVGNGFGDTSQGFEN